MIDIVSKRVLVTGGTSMIGREICQALYKRNCVIDNVPHRECDLLDFNETLERIKTFNPDYIIHAAGFNGGIAFNKEFPATIYYRTATMALNVYQSAALVYNLNNFKIKKIVGLLASCSYPDIGHGYFDSCELWNGRPNPTVECHGLSKRIIADFGRQIEKQHGISCISCIVNNSFGPYDKYNEQKGKVISGLIKRFVEAKQQNLPEVVCWGDGSPKREFIFCRDAAEAIVQSLEKYEDKLYPINITSGDEMTIKQLTETIVKIVGYEGKVVWDTSKANGQMRKSLANKEMVKTLDVKMTPFEDALRETIQWYIDNKEVADAGV